MREPMAILLVSAFGYPSGGSVGSCDRDEVDIDKLPHIETVLGLLLV